MAATDAEVLLEPVHDLARLGIRPVPAFVSQIDKLLWGLARLVLNSVRYAWNDTVFSSLGDYGENRQASYRGQDSMLLMTCLILV